MDDILISVQFSFNLLRRCNILERDKVGGNVSTTLKYIKIRKYTKYKTKQIRSAKYLCQQDAKKSNIIAGEFYCALSCCVDLFPFVYEWIISLHLILYC